MTSRASDTSYLGPDLDLCYFLIMTAMAETVYTHSLEKRGREQAAAKIEPLARILYPALL